MAVNRPRRCHTPAIPPCLYSTRAKLTTPEKEKVNALSGASNMHVCPIDKGRCQAWTWTQGGKILRRRAFKPQHLQAYTGKSRNLMETHMTLLRYYARFIHVSKTTQYTHALLEILLQNQTFCRFDVFRKSIPRRSYCFLVHVGFQLGYPVSAAASMLQGQTSTFIRNHKMK